MDYKKIYNLKYNETRGKIAQEFLEHLKRGKCKGFQFRHAYKPLSEAIKKKIEDLKVKYFEKEYTKVLEVFNCSYQIYDEENLLNTLNNESFEEFKIANNKTTLKYQVFVKELAHYNSLKDTLRIISNNDYLHSIMYQANDFKNFTFEFIEGDVLESNIFKKEYNRLYPVAKVYKLIIENGVSKNVCIEPEIIKTKINIGKKDKNSIIRYDLTKFSEDEKILLKHIYLIKRNANLPKTELLKASRLSQVDDLTFLNNCDSSNTTYTKFTKGLNYYEDKNTKRKLIDGLIENIEGYGLNKITELLRSERRKI